MKLMVVDDESDVQYLFKQQFRHEIRSGEIEFRFAFSGEEALQYLSTNEGLELVLILSDINMPGMSGLDLLRTIKQRLPHLRVFMITAYSDEKNFNSAISGGADGYLTKPIDFADLKQSLRQFQNQTLSKKGSEGQE